MFKDFRFWAMILIIAAVLILISLFLMKRMKNKFMAKTLPSLLMWFVSIVFLIYSIFFAKPMQDLGYLVMSYIAGLASLIALIVVIIIDRKQSKK